MDLVPSAHHNELLSEFEQHQAHARNTFEHEEFLASAQSWKNCATVAKKLNRDDLRALAYRHLSFALRGCGQTAQADEAYRRAMKYEQRAAPQSPENLKHTQSKEGSKTHSTSSWMIDALEEDDGQPLGLATTGLRSSRSALQQSLHATRNTPMQRHRTTLLDTKEQEHRSFSASHHVVSSPHDYLTSEEYEQGLQALAEANALLRDEVETLKRQHTQDNAVQKQTTDRIQQESEQVERLNKALKQEEERSALLTNELTELQASNTQCELHYGRERVAYESTIDTLTANVQQWQSTSNAKEKDTVQLKEKMNTMVAEMEELKTVANENKHLLLDKERKANALEKALQEMTQEKENVRQQTVHLTQDLEHQKTRILDCERSREEDAHHLTKTKTMATELAALRDEVLLKNSTLKKKERMNEELSTQVTLLTQEKHSLELQCQHLDHSESELKKSNDKFQLKIKNQLKSMDDRDRTVQQLTAECNALKEQLSKTVQQHETLVQEQTHQQEEHRQLVQKSNRLKDQVEQAKQDSKKKASLYSNALEDKDLVIATVTAEQHNQQDRIAKLEKEVLASKHKGIALEEQLLACRSNNKRTLMQSAEEVKQMKYENKETKEQMAHLNVVVETHQARCAQYETDNTQVRQELSALTKENTGLKQLLVDTQGKMKKMMVLLDHFDSTKKNLTQAKKENETMHLSQHKLSMEVERLTVQLNQTMEQSHYHEQNSLQLTSAEMKINELNLSLHKTHSLTMNMTKESEWYKSEYTRVNAQFNTLETKHHELVKQHQVQTKTLHVLKTQLQSIQKKCNDDVAAVEKEKHLECTEALTQLNALQHQYDTLQLTGKTNLTHSHQQLHQLQQDHNSVLERLEVMENNLTTKNNTISAVTAKHQDCKHLLVQVETKLQHALSENHALSERKERESIEHQTALAECQENEKKWTLRNTTLNEELLVLRNVSRTTEEQLREELNSVLEEHRRTVHRLTTEHDVATRAMERSQQDQVVLVDKYRNESRRRKEEHRAVQSVSEALKEEVRVEKEKNNVLRINQDHLHQQCNQAVREKEVLDTTVAALQEEHQTLVSKLHACHLNQVNDKAKKNEYERTIESLTGERSTLQKVLEEHQHKIKSLTSQIKTLTTTTTTLTTQVNTGEARVAVMAPLLSSLTQEKEQWTKEKVLYDRCQVECARVTFELAEMTSGREKDQNQWNSQTTAWKTQVQTTVEELQVERENVRVLTEGEVRLKKEKKTLQDTVGQRNTTMSQQKEELKEQQEKLQEQGRQLHSLTMQHGNLVKNHKTTLLRLTELTQRHEQDTRAHQQDQERRQTETSSRLRHVEEEHQKVLLFLKQEHQKTLLATTAKLEGVAQQKSKLQQDHEMKTAEYENISDLYAELKEKTARAAVEQGKQRETLNALRLKVVLVTTNYDNLKKENTTHLHQKKQVETHFNVLQQEHDTLQQHHHALETNHQIATAKHVEVVKKLSTQLKSAQESESRTASALSKLEETVAQQNKIHKEASTAWTKSRDKLEQATRTTHNANVSTIQQLTSDKEHLAQELRKYQELSNVNAVHLKKLEMAKTVLLTTQKELMQREEDKEQRIGVLQQQKLQHEHEHKTVKSTLHRLEEEVQGLTKTISEHEKKEIRLQHQVNRLTQQTVEKDKQLVDQENTFNKVNGQRQALAKEKDTIVAQQAVVEEKYHTSTRDCTQLQQQLHAMKVMHTEVTGTLREAEKELEAKREQELSTARRLTTITTELSTATKTNKQHKAQWAQLTTSFDQVSLKNEELIATLSRTCETLKHTEADKFKINANCQTLRTERDAMVRTHNEKNTHLTQTITRLTQELGQLREQEQTSMLLREDLQQLEQQTSVLLQQVNSSNARAEKDQQALVQFEHQVMALSTSVSVEQSKVAALESQLGEVHQSKTRAVSELQSNLANLQREKEQWTVDHAALREEHVKLQSEYHYNTIHVNTALAKVTAEYTELKKEHAALSVVLGKAQDENKDWARQQEAGEKAQVVLKEQVRAAQTQVVAMEANLHDCTRTLEEMQNSNERLSNVLLPRLEEEKNRMEQQWRQEQDEHAVTLLQLKHIGEELGETNGLLCTAREEMQSKAEDTKRRQDDMHQQLKQNALQAEQNKLELSHLMASSSSPLRHSRTAAVPLPGSGVLGVDGIGGIALDVSATPTIAAIQILKHELHHSQKSLSAYEVEKENLAKSMLKKEEQHQAGMKELEYIAGERAKALDRLTVDNQKKNDTISALNIALAEKTTTLRHYEEDIQSLSLVLGDGGGPFGGGSSRSVIGAAVRVLSPRKSTIVKEVREALEEERNKEEEEDRRSSRRGRRNNRNNKDTTVEEDEEEQYRNYPQLTTLKQAVKALTVANAQMSDEKVRLEEQVRAQSQQENVNAIETEELRRRKQTLEEKESQLQVQLQEKDSAHQLLVKEMLQHKEDQHEMDKKLHVVVVEKNHLMSTLEEKIERIAQLEHAVEEQKRKSMKLASDIEESNKHGEEQAVMAQALTDELNDNTVEVARLRERCEINDSAMVELKTALDSKTVQFSNLETDHLHLQQLWISMQHHDHPGASPATFQHHMQSAFHPKNQEQERIKQGKQELEELKQERAKEKEEQKRDQEREDKRKKEEQMWKETLDDANTALEEMQQSMLHSSQQLTIKTQEHQQLLKEFNRLETSTKEHATLSSKQQKTQEEKYTVLEQSLTESEQGKQQMHNTLSSYKQAMVLVEECVHDVRAEGETFLSNLEGERRHHEAQVVSTDYTPTAHPVLSPHKKKAAVAARAVEASGGVGGNSRVERAQERKEEQDKTVITKMDLTSTLGMSGSSSGLGSGKNVGSMFVSTEQRDTMLTIFESIDRHHTGTVNVRDLLLALRRDQKISTFLHLPMQIHQEDPSRTTVQHIFNVIDTNHDSSITWVEFFEYFCTHVYDVHSSAFVAHPQHHSPRVSSPLSKSMSLHPSSPLRTGRSTSSTSSRPQSPRLTSSPRPSSLSHSSFGDISQYPLHLAGSHAQRHTIAGSSSSSSSSATNGGSTKTAGPTHFTFDTPSQVGGAVVQKIIKLCHFLKASVEHERHIVSQYVHRLHERELHHADTIDDMHLGDGGVLVLKKQLNSSQSMNTHLESKLNEHSTTITIKRTQIEELNKKYQQVKHNNAALTATNEKQHEELLAIKDEHMHLVHDVERYQAQLTTLTDKEAAAQQNIQVLKEVTHDLENKLSYSMQQNSSLTKYQKTNEKRVNTLGVRCLELKKERDHHKNQASHHESGHESTKLMHSAVLDHHAQTKGELEQELKHLGAERDELLGELKSISKALDEERRKRHLLETTLKQADAHISAEVDTRIALQKEMEVCQQELQHVQGLLDDNQKQTLSLTKDIIHNANVINEWKIKYKSLEEQLTMTVHLHEEENFRTRNQLSALGSAMVQDATLLEKDIHHVEEDLVTNVKERQQENDRLREIQRMLLSGNKNRAAAGSVVVGGQTHKRLDEGGVSSLLESKLHY